MSTRKPAVQVLAVAIAVVVIGLVQPVSAAVELGSGVEQVVRQPAGDAAGFGESLHFLLEFLQVALAVVAVVAVVLAGRVYGGEIGTALIVSGIGVSLFALQRLWHAFHDLGVLAAPPAMGDQTLFILGAGALAIGYLSLYRTMSTRLG